MELVPTPKEARWIIASVITFWGIGTVLDLGGLYDSGLGTTLFFVAFAAGLRLFWTVNTIAARETGRSVWSYFGFRRPRLRGAWAEGRQDWQVLFKLMDPRWYWRVIRTTGWPARVTAAALFSAFLLVVVTAVHMFTATPT